MLHSATSSKQNFNMFQLFIYQILNGDNSYKDSVDSIIDEAKLLANGKKDIYSINRSNFSIIYHLSSSLKEFISKLDTHNISEEDYKYLFEKLQKESELISQ